MEKQPSDSSLCRRHENDRSDSKESLKLEAFEDDDEEECDVDIDKAPDNPEQISSSMQTTQEVANGSRIIDNDDIEGGEGFVDESPKEHDEVLVEVDAEVGVDEGVGNMGGVTKTVDSRKKNDEILVHSDLDAEPIIPVASARIIPVDEPIITVTALPPEQDEEYAVYAQQQSSSSQQAVANARPPGRIASHLAQRVMVDEDGSSARQLMRDAMQLDKPPAPSWKSKKTCVRILIISTVIVIVGVVIATVVVLAGDKGTVDDDFLPQTKAPNRTTSSKDWTASPSRAPTVDLPYQWAVEEFGYPDNEEGKTYPWSEYDTLEECREYCEFISNGFYKALAFVSNAGGRMEDSTSIKPVYPTDADKPNCYCYSIFETDTPFCLLDFAAIENNGTVLSSVPKPPNCIFDDDNVGNVTDSVMIGNDRRRE